MEASEEHMKAAPRDRSGGITLGLSLFEVEQAPGALNLRLGALVGNYGEPIRGEFPITSRGADRKLRHSKKTLNFRRADHFDYFGYGCHTYINDKFLVLIQDKVMPL